MAQVRGNFIPTFSDVRRVPVRYHRTLPLAVSKRYQCVVLGATSRTLTVGVTEQESEALLDFLHALTGAAIFPVLVEPKRMHLLIARIERYQHFYEQYRWSSYRLQRTAQVRLILALRER